MDGKKKKEAGCFQMPLHYPKYTMKDYQTMPEWQLDRLLADYGLPVHDELAYKREFAIGAFLWPKLSARTEAFHLTYIGASTSSSAIGFLMCLTSCPCYLPAAAV
ncbi:hypothetical protein OIU84_028202 [Salix udensis]|uniref:DUF7722 domain-containing protein n=1 Tax=Salix udensis TaxID=889485 RepID=A0AAD6KC27_9ROSI|nr:hypothetical protein OIU84_028202 [Salix udensis]